jgi:hypothetical protein
MTQDSKYIYSGGSSYFRDLSQTLFRQAMNDGDGTNRTSPLGAFKYCHSDRSSSTVKNLYENAAALGPYTQSTSIEAVNFLLLGLGSSYSSSKISLFYCGASFSAGEVTSFYNALIGWGWVTKKGGKYLTYVNSEVDPEEVITLDKPFRGFKHWHKYTDAQIDSVVSLLKLWNDKYSIDISYNPDIWDVTQRALKGENGVFTHCSVRKDKFDVFPQPELIEALKSL